MNPICDPASEPRPRDFSARLVRARPRRIALPRRKSRKGRIALLLTGALALPAFAQPGEWDRFEIGPAGEAVPQIEPMPYEKAGSSFPGSAFYYLSLEDDEPQELGDGIQSDAGVPFYRQQQLDTGPAALAMRVDASVVDRSRAIDCLTAAVYYEAASEPDIGQRAVAQVVLNRVAHPSYPSTVCGVVYQGSNRRTGCQFSFTCDGSLARRPSAMFWNRARGVALSALAGYVHEPAGLATHYHTTAIYPYWAPSLDYLSTIGAHRFYRFKGRAGQRGAFRFAYLGGEPSRGALKHSAVAQDSASELNPAMLQKAFDAGLAQAQSESVHHEASADAQAPAPVYASPVRERGGDALYKGEALPEATGIREEYRNSGRWIRKPGS